MTNCNVKLFVNLLLYARLYLRECFIVLDGEDYVSTTVTLTFNGTSTTACTDISITFDDVYEGNETFSVSLTTTDNNVTLNPDGGQVTITDDDGKSKIIRQNY